MARGRKTSERLRAASRQGRGAGNRPRERPIPEAQTEAPEISALTRSQVAELFSACPNTISNWVRWGILRPVRIGRRLFFMREEIERLVREGAPARSRTTSDR